VRRLTTQEFIAKSRSKHRNTYDYSLVNYRGNKIKVIIICRRHGTFHQLPTNHYRHGCVLCRSDSSATRYRKPREKFIDEAFTTHEKKFKYDLVKYVNSLTKVEIICREHGSFWQRPSEHLKGKGCRACARQIPVTDEEYLERFNRRHNNKYLYPDFTYICSQTKIKVQCPIHGLFEVLPYNHLAGNGCYKCKTSRGEDCVAMFLDLLGVSYERQKRFAGCRLKFELPFDFFISPNILIEFDGHGHSAPVNWGGKVAKEVIKKNYDLVLTKDEIKNRWAKENGFTLLRIDYKDDLIARMADAFKADKWKGLCFSSSHRTRIKQQHDILKKSTKYQPRLKLLASITS